MKNELYQSNFIKKHLYFKIMTHRTIMKHKWLLAPLILIAIAAFTLVTMLLWNATMPIIFHLPVITFVQALCLLILSKIFFGGHMGRGHNGHMGMRNRMASMSPEEREKFFKHIHERQGPWWNKRWDRPSEETENKPV
jgi:hypothetical protein